LNSCPDFLALPTSLQSLDLSGNHLSARTIPFISSFPSLRRLSLARNFLGNFFQSTNIASTFSFALLEDLDLRSVNLTSMPTALFPLLPRLRSLDLSYNILPQLTEKSFSNASLLLENLTLSHCRLKSVDGYTWLNLPNLLSLDLSNNVLSNGTDIMDFPKSLRKLKVAKNRLTTLPDLQVAVPNLVWLDASENLLTGVNFNSLPIGSLRHLDLNGNLLTAIPNFSSTNNETGHSSDFLGALGWMMQTGRNVNRTSVLEMLDVSWNRIERIERLSVDLQNITELNLSGNKIEVLPERFLENLKRLEKVNLSRNLLTGLENQTFIKLPQLKTLDLSYNKLKVK
jgi:Leucine-rich repeat (LRR) protein